MLNLRKTVACAALALVIPTACKSKQVGVAEPRSEERASAGGAPGPTSTTADGTVAASPPPPAPSPEPVVVEAEPGAIGADDSGGDDPAAPPPAGAATGASSEARTAADGRGPTRGKPAVTREDRSGDVEGEEARMGRREIPEEPQVQATAGQLTAGDWDDNLNADFFRDYLAGVRAARPDLPAVALADRVTIRVVDEVGAPIRNALVTVRSAQHPCLSAPTGPDGRLLFFPSHDCGQPGERFTVSAARADRGAAPVHIDSPKGNAWTVTLPGRAAARARALDLALLIDATGSMGDEMAYVREEIRGVVESVSAAVPGVSLRFSLIVYRDQGDEYVTRVFPFTDNLDVLRRQIAAQRADGGGDYPEALDKGMAALAALNWRSGDVARVAFLIADAPPHTDRAAAYLAGVEQLRRKGVHIYPVGASGVADEAEYLFRVTAALTQARYLFLTDDSGIGNSHAEPHIPCYSVQRLDDLFRRMVLFELTGEPARPREIIRTVGQPVDGRCTTSAGQVVLIAR